MSVANHRFYSLTIFLLLFVLTVSTNAVPLSAETSVWGDLELSAAAKRSSGPLALHGKDPGGAELEAIFESALPWASGYSFSAGKTFNGSIADAAVVFGSSLSTLDLTPVEIRFSSTETTLCQTFRRDLGYPSSGIGTFPGSAWDISDPLNPRRLNICFVEDATSGNANLQWDPLSTGVGGREYLFVMASDYDGTGNSYAGMNIISDASSIDSYYFWWPLIASGFTLLQSEPATLTITPYHVSNLVGIPESGKITLGWNYPLPAAGFKVWYGTSSPPTTLLDIMGPDENRYYDNGLTDGNSYYYMVEAIDSAGEVIDNSKVLEAIPMEMGNNMSLLDFWHGRARYGDIWGYTDSSGNEYALICARDEGVSIVDIGVSPPVEVGFMPCTPGMDAKDVKLYGHYAFVVKEYEDMQVFDISDVTNPVQVATWAPDGNGAHNCLIDGDYLYVIGNHGIGGVEIVDISNPAAPVEVGDFQPFYYHDLGIHNDMLCGVGIYGEGTDLIDVSNKTAPSLINRFNYTGSGAHNAEFTPDGNFVFIGDEIGSSGNHTRVFNVQNTDSIQQAAEIIVDPNAVTHNCYLKDNRLYIAHYSEGLRVIDVTDPTTPSEVASYDTYQPAEYGYVGAWSVYPYFESGKVIVSDMQSGLFVIQLDLEPPSCCGMFTSGQTGNTDCSSDGKRNLADITQLIDRVYISKTALCCELNGNTDGDAEGKLNLADITVLIDHVYISKTETGTCL